MELHVYWLLQISSISSIFLWNYALLKYYTDPHETVKVTLFIQVLAFSSVMIYILLIPFDVFATVRHHDILFSFKDPLLEYLWNVRIYDLYFICYVGMILLCFVWLPFSYFYAQSVQEEEEMIMEASITLSNKNSSQQQQTPSHNVLKGMDSSDSQSDEEESTNKATDLASA
jgi:amino acid permease